MPSPDHTGLGNISSSPYFLKTPDLQMIVQERQRHNEAVYALGEHSFHVLLWHIEDYEAGACQRCPYCSQPGDSIQNAVFSAYKQPILNKCPQCYGTTYFKTNAAAFGGLKARIVRPCIWDTADVEHKMDQRGEVASSTSTLQSTSDFRMRSGDFVFRADGTRWRVQEIKTDFIVSGMQASDDLRTMIGYSYPGCKQEAETSVAFTIPPDKATVQSLLDISLVPNYPIDFSSHEIINGALIADDFAVGV
jgi:hypothetical protein